MCFIIERPKIQNPWTLLSTTNNFSSHEAEYFTYIIPIYFCRNITLWKSKTDSIYSPFTATPRRREWTSASTMSSRRPRPNWSMTSGDWGTPCSFTYPCWIRPKTAVSDHHVPVSAGISLSSWEDRLGW